MALYSEMVTWSNDESSIDVGGDEAPEALDEVDMVVEKYSVREDEISLGVDQLLVTCIGVVREETEKRLEYYAVCSGLVYLI